MSEKKYRELVADIRKMDRDIRNKKKALQEYLKQRGIEIKINKISQSYWSDEKLYKLFGYMYDEEIFEVLGHSYFVLKDDEADKLARERMRDNAWTFNAEFIAKYCRDGVTVEQIKAVQNNLCVTTNELIMVLIEDEDKFINDTLTAKGRGFFLSDYDGNETKIQIGNEYFYIYQMD